ncbi:MAG: four helix bundle protein [Kiritimatiellae bacterium]|nr:four helix bundle protein [Kiritimatiellia bacterium]
MNEQEFKDRTKSFALKIITFVDQLPKTTSGLIISKQLLRSACSVGANYRAACRAKSTADMISKLSTAEEEADESLYWMEILNDSGKCGADKLTAIMTECNEITAIIVASIKTLRKRLN